jgi:cellulase/cellobiase CelA1
VTVTNTGASTVLWQTSDDVGGSITSLWNAQATAADPLTHFMGEQWNDTLQAGESTAYGYCAER